MGIQCIKTSIYAECFQVAMRMRFIKIDTRCNIAKVLDAQEASEQMARALENKRGVARRHMDHESGDARQRMHASTQDRTQGA